MLRAALVFTIAFAAALLASMSGGSASAITTPVWLSLGIPLPLAVATDKLQGALWTLLGARNYLRARPVDGKLLAGMSLIGVLGAWLGARATMSLDPARLKPALGVMILGLMLMMAMKPGIGTEAKAPRLGRGAVAAAALPLGFYEGMLGSGNGILTTLLLSGARGMELATALGHYFVLAFAWCALAAAVYIRNGYFDPALAVPAVIGGCMGGYLGSRFTSGRRTRFLRALFLVMGTALGLRLLLGS
jgi:uncharacterized membrane protein YfcA